MGNLKFAYHGEKKVKLEVDTTRVAPVRAKPPPKPPSAFSIDKVVGKGAEKGRKERMEFRLKRGRWAQRQGAQRKG